MRVAFRADASVQIGSGHVMRCLSLADALRARGAEAYFVGRALPGHLGALIRERGYDLALLPAPAPPAPSVEEEGDEAPAHAQWLGVPWPQDAAQTAQALQAAGDFDWLVVDHYAVDARWENSLRRTGRSTLVIDDLADRPHDCDLLLDVNLQEPEGRYAGLVPAWCRQLLGPAYALLRPQFAAARPAPARRDGRVARLLIFFGGSDHDNLTGRALTALGRLGRDDLAVDVVLGASNPRRSELEALCASLKSVTCHFNVADMAALMAAADLAIGAAGVTTWERACLGLPALVVTIAANQRPTAACAARRGILTWLGDASEVTAATLAEAVRVALAAPATLLAQSRRGMDVVDGGGTARVAAAMSR